MVQAGATQGAAAFTPVILGADAAAYGLARSFAEGFGAQSTVLAPRILPICENSSIVRAVAVPELDQAAHFADALRAAAGSLSADAPRLLVPTERRFARLLAQQADRLADAFRFTVAPSALVERLSTLSGFAAVCDEHGLPHPAFFTVGGPDDTVGCPYPFPVVLRPDDPDAYAPLAFTGKKNRYHIRNRAELNHALSMVYGAGYAGRMAVCCDVPGDDDALCRLTCYCASDNTVRLVAQADAVLEEGAPWTLGRFGAAIAGDDRELADRVEAFLSRIGYKGYASLSLKYDAVQDCWLFLDFNPAVDETGYLATAAGQNLAGFAVRDAVGLPAGDEAAAAPGTCAHLEGDAVLFSRVPDSTIRQYAGSQASWPRTQRLLQQKKVVGLFLPAYDKGFARWKAYRSDQHFYRREFADCYGRDHVND